MAVHGAMPPAKLSIKGTLMGLRFSWFEQRVSAKRTSFGLALLAVVVSLPHPAHAQADNAPEPTARDLAPIDLTGYWTAVVTEDWPQRMLDPTKGDFGAGPPGAVQTPGRVPVGLGPNPADEGNIPYEAAGSRAALAWDPGANDHCLAYGAPGILRQATRLHISWIDDNTLRLNTDLGATTRSLHFAPAPRPGRMNYIGGRYVPEKKLADFEVPAGLDRSSMGFSVARWTAFGGQNYVAGGYLKVETTNLTRGYYWRNGMPYTEDAKLIEHFRTMTLPDGSSWILLTLKVEDPEYLTQPFLVNYHFRKLPNDSSWNPQPCG
jgi:hypothetical protein